MQHVQVKHQAVPTSGNGSSLSHLLLHYDDGSSFQAHHGISLTSEQKPPNSPFPTFQQPPFPPPFRWFSIKMMMVTKMMMRYLTTSTRGSFPPGFPGLRLPGLRFHPHFGEPKVIWKYKLSFLILSTTTGWRTLSSRSTSLCTSPWRSGQLQEKLHICCLFSCTPQYLIHYFMLSIYHFAISLFSCKKMYIWGFQGLKYLMQNSSSGQIAVPSWPARTRCSAHLGHFTKLASEISIFFFMLHILFYHFHSMYHKVLLATHPFGTSSKNLFWNV